VGAALFFLPRPNAHFPALKISKDAVETFKRCGRKIIFKAAKNFFERSKNPKGALEKSKPSAGENKFVAVIYKL